jgi:hypothetical protein
MATNALNYDPASIGHRLRTQSNWHITSDPMYLVRRKERIYGIEAGYEDACTWIHIEEGEEATQNTINLLEARFHKDGTSETKNYRRVGYVERDEHIQTFLTEAAAQEFMQRNKHRYGDMHLYVDYGYRNWEWQEVRKHLMSLPEA